MYTVEIISLYYYFCVMWVPVCAQVHVSVQVHTYGGHRASSVPLGACYFAFFLRRDPSLRLELTAQARSCPGSQRNPGALPPM